MKVHLFLLIILLLLNTIPQHKINRRKYILPFSFLLVCFYWAFRYDYGLDYWNYYSIFIGDLTLQKMGWGERLFYRLLNLFDYYYQAIIAESIVIVLSLYNLIKKYFPIKYYWLFFLLLFCVTSFHFNLISAMRSTLAACVLYWAFDLFYISKKRWGYFMLLVFVASNLHTSAMVFFITPLIHYGFNSLKGKTIFIVLIVANILSVFLTQRLFSLGVSLVGMFMEYGNYAEIMSNTNIIGFLYKSALLFPSYFLCKFFDDYKDDVCFRKLSVLSFTYLFLFFSGLDFQGRFTVYLFPFFMIAFAIVYIQVSHDEKIIMLVPYLLFLMYSLYSYYTSMYAGMTGRWSYGNTYYYKTIFDAPRLP